MPSVAASIVTSRTNPRVKQLRAACAGNARLSGGLVALEGEHLLLEAVRSGTPLHTVFVSAERDLPAALAAQLPESTELVRLAADVFGSAVETPSPQGLAALFMPPQRRLQDALTGTPLLLVAAGVQDPGNLGTLIRSAEAFGATGLLTTPGTVSPWNQKALRASVGSIFRLPVVSVTTAELAALRPLGIRLLAAVGSSASTPPLPAYSAELQLPCALLIGNEGAGLAPEYLALADATITIPCPGPVESLNAAVAGSLLLYEAARQREAHR
ncbi:MAG: RNA methyltransferase [Acidobacteriota bacterium]|nr:RNA methyltransferase [Acidobacteriota bacterium]